MAREQWASKIGVIMAVAGSAIGLGNFLRFPGQVVQHAGSQIFRDAAHRFPPKAGWAQIVQAVGDRIDPWRDLEAAGIQPNGEHAMEPVEDAVMAVWREMLAAGKLEPKPSAAKCA